MLDSGYEIPNDEKVSPDEIQPKADLRRADLTEANLEAADLSEANLRFADLTGTDLEQANLSEATLEEANLIGTNLEEANLSGANLRGTDVLRADLIDADLSETYLMNADLSESNLIGADLTGADLRYADLSKTNFHNSNLSETNLYNANLAEADFTYADLSEGDLRGAGFSGTDFLYTDLTGADLRDTALSGMNLRGAYITDADLRGANVNDVLMSATTTCNRLYEGYDASRYLPRPIQRAATNSNFSVKEWDDTVRAYNEIKTAFSENALTGKAQKMHVGERRARSYQAKKAGGWFSWDYLSTLPSRFITGYGVRLRTLMFWMLLLFIGPTTVYLHAGIRDTTSEIITYSVLAFTVAPPPPLPPGTFVQIVVMIQTFFGTLSTVLLGYILGNRERI